MSDALAGKVVVLLGASRGLGRAAALELARRGARLVLAARDPRSLTETQRMCEQLGALALVQVTDATVAAEVERLAVVAVTHFGCIDVWINNAGVTLFALLEQAPFLEHQRVIETNLYGSIHGARAALPIFRTQRRGTLINVGSILSMVGHAFVPSYVISKFAIRGLTEALRVELADEPDIHVCGLYPYAIDTQHFESAANELQRKAWAMAPAQSPEKVARALSDLAARPRRELCVPRSAKLILALHSLMPRTFERVLLHALQRWHLRGPQERAPEGNLFRPSEQQARIHGRRSPRVSTPRLLAFAARDALGLLAGDALRTWRRARGLPSP